MWTYKTEPFLTAPEEYLGFVYLITNLKTGRKYIGQKKFTFAKTKTVKGKKKKFRTESDWQLYYGSNPQLQEDVKALGAEHFLREILFLCKRKSEMNYIELREQMIADAIMKPLEFYNAYVGGRISRKQLGIA